MACPAEGRPSILVVDDRDENISLVEATLSDLDVNVLKASSGEQALELLDTREFALLLLDVCMPGMDGVVLARSIMSRTNPPPILLNTALACNDDTVEEAYEIGVADFLFKPFAPVVLRAKVQVFVELFRIRHSEYQRTREMEKLYQDLLRRQSEVQRLATELAEQKAELDLRNRDLILRNTQLNSFAHVMSHDLRQPLGSILDYLELIKDFAGNSPGGCTFQQPALRWIELSLKVGRGMQDLIENVLAYSRLGRIQEMSIVDTNAALNRAHGNLQAGMKESGARIFHESLPAVFGSESLLTCLFQNLICNAIKYRSALTPKVRITTAWIEEESKWLFRVFDNGRGFKCEDTARIFEMFSRCDESRSIPGAGIGLAICKRIVEDHGGRIWAQPASQGGAEFAFLLPGIAPEANRPARIGETNVN
jgi:signal transduction histidine kinase